MIAYRRTNSSGSSLIEMSAVLVIISMGVFGSLNILGSGGDFVTHTKSRLRTDESNRNAMGSIERMITEGSTRFMDTAMRVHVTGSIDFLSDRFIFTNLPFSQCSSPVCRFHTDAGQRLSDSHFQVGHEFRTGGGVLSAVRGKVWPELLAQCPLDGSPTLQMATMDCLKMFSARRGNGAFNTTGGAGPAPAWSTLVIVAPYATREGKGQLRRYRFDITDLLGGIVDSSGDSPFDLNPIDMVTLFDFGTDGTLDGTPDGSVPVRPEASDAEQEAFFVANLGEEPAVIITKSLGSSAKYPWRTLTYTVRLRDGNMSMTVSHRESATVFWTASRTLTRPPATLVNNLTEFVVSTSESNPYDAAANPDGVPEDGVVRVTVGTTNRVNRKGGTQWSHGVETLVIKPRNQ